VTDEEKLELASCWCILKYSKHFLVKWGLR